MWRRSLYPTEELCILTVCYRLKSRVLQTPVECVSTQTGSARGFWKEDLVVLLLTSVALIVLFCASQWLYKIMSALYLVLWRCLCTLQPSAPMYISGISFPNFTLLHHPFNMLLHATFSPHPTSMLWCCSALAAFAADVVKTQVGKTGFPLIIWMTSGHKAKGRRWRRTFVLEGGWP